MAASDKTGWGESAVEESVDLHASRFPWRVDRNPQPSGPGDNTASANSERIDAMTADNSGPFDLCCFSYTAPSEVLRLTAFPVWDGGSEIISSDLSFAGDGPLVAATASGLGLSVALETNDVGDDEGGQIVRSFLERTGVNHRLDVGNSQTPRAFILAHPDGAREWLAQLQQAPSELAQTDGHLIREAALLYVDCFESIADGAIQAIGIAGEFGVPVFANVGSLLPDNRLRGALAASELAVIQGSIPERDAATALTRLTELAETTHAELVIVTVGALGAVARKREEKTPVVAPARSVTIDYTHGAGAAFSAGLIFARRQEWTLERQLEVACALGSMQCTLERRESPSPDDVARFMSAHEQRPTVADSDPEGAVR